MTPKWMQVLVLSMFCAVMGCPSGPSAPLRAAAQPDTSSAQPVAAAPVIGSTKINPKDGAVMVYVPAGQFLMGSKQGEGYQQEHPQHEVYLDGYWIYKNDVTVAQYRKFCTATRRNMPDRPVRGWKEDHPVVCVSWDDAKAYCDWVGTTLPTEAQWEKAARGTDGRNYPWGNDWDKTKGNSADSGLKATTPVGSYPGGASPYGCLDMAGNVWQWCADWYGPYDAAATENPAGPATGGFRVLRGGSWVNPSGSCRSAYRGDLNPVGRGYGIGFRCVGPAGLP